MLKIFLLDCEGCETMAAVDRRGRITRAVWGNLRESGGKVKTGKAAGVEGRTKGRRLHSGSKESGVHATAQRRDECGSAGGVAGVWEVAEGERRTNLSRVC